MENIKLCTEGHGKLANGMYVELLLCFLKKGSPVCDTAYRAFCRERVSYMARGVKHTKVSLWMENAVELESKHTRAMIRMLMKYMLDNGCTTNVKAAVLCTWVCVLHWFGKIIQLCILCCLIISSIVSFSHLHIGWDWRILVYKDSMILTTEIQREERLEPILMRCHACSSPSSTIQVRDWDAVITPGLQSG